RSHSSHTASDSTYSRSLHDALPIWGAVLRSDAALFCAASRQLFLAGVFLPVWLAAVRADLADFADRAGLADGPRLLAGAACGGGDRERTRLNSSHVSVSYAVVCFEK